MEKKNIIRLIGELATGKGEPPLFSTVVYDADELNDEEIDIVLIKNMKGLSEHDCFGYLDDSWRAQTDDISAGEYPLEKLPEYVREIARELYYDRDNKTD